MVGEWEERGVEGEGGTSADVMAADISRGTSCWQGRQGRWWVHPWEVEEGDREGVRIMTTANTEMAMAQSRPLRRPTHPLAKTAAPLMP
jgi:hypothetical protein